MNKWFPFVSMEKYQKALQAVQILRERERDAALFRGRIADVSALAEANRYQLLALETLNGNEVVVFIQKVCEDNLLLWLYQVSRMRPNNWVCRMDMEYRGRDRALLVDWRSKSENAGYGSLLLKHAISFLKCAGFSTLTGVIHPIDFDREDKLRHIYQKFGFAITDFPNERRLFLDLKDRP